MDKAISGDGHSHYRSEQKLRCALIASLLGFTMSQGSVALERISARSVIVAPSSADDASIPVLPLEVAPSQLQAIGGTRLRAIGGTRLRSEKQSATNAIGGTRLRGNDVSETNAIGGTRLRAIGGTRVRAIGGTRARAIGGTRLRAIGGTRLRACEAGEPSLAAIGGTRLRSSFDADLAAIGGTRLRAIGGTRLRASEDAALAAIGGTRLRAIGGTRLRSAAAGSTVSAIGGTRLRSTADSSVAAIGGTRVRAIGGTRLRASDAAAVNAIGGTRVRSASIEVGGVGFDEVIVGPVASVDGSGLIEVFGRSIAVTETPSVGQMVSVVSCLTPDGREPVSVLLHDTWFVGGVTEVVVSGIVSAVASNEGWMELDGEVRVDFTGLLGGADADVGAEIGDTVLVSGVAY